MSLKDKEVKKLKKKLSSEIPAVSSNGYYMLIEKELQKWKLMKGIILGISELPDLRFRDSHFGTSTPQHLRHKDYHYQGMLECKKSDYHKLFQIILTSESVNDFIHIEKRNHRSLCSDLKPRLAASLTPCLPAYVIFMCLRHADYLQDEERFVRIFDESTNTIVALVQVQLTNQTWIEMLFLKKIWFD